MTLTVQIPQVGQANSTEEPKIANTLTNLSAWANGGIAPGDVNTAFAQSAAINQLGQTVKGAVSIATSETRANTAYGLMTTPDQVAGLVLPTNGLIAVWYQATWQQSAAGQARAAIFVGTNQLKIAAASYTAPITQAAVIDNTTINSNTILASTPGGLASCTPGPWGGDVTTGQVIGLPTAASTLALYEEWQGAVVNTGAAAVFTSAGPCYIFAAAGTYTVSVQYKVSVSGSVTASNRKLWVQALSFS